MSVNSADFQKAIVTVWNASGLNATFQALWDAGVAVSEHAVLRDSEAAPKDPFPYCVMETTMGVTTDRMSGPDGTLREIRDLEVVFSVNARAVSGDARTSKEIAADLGEEIMKIYGGHPEVSPTDLELDNGNFLISEYQGDVGVRLDEDQHQWRTTYLFRSDVPVAV